MPVERRGWVTHGVVGQRETGGTQLSRRKASAFVEWHEPDEANSHVRICERLGVKFPGPTRPFTRRRFSVASFTEK